MFNLPTLLATLTYVLAVVLLVSSVFDAYLLPAVPVLYLIALLAQAGRPLVLVLRRFAGAGSEEMLMRHVLSNVSAFGRVVWLDDTRVSYPLVTTSQDTPLASIVWFSGGIAMAFYLREKYGIPITLVVAATVLVLCLSFFVIGYAVGNPPARVLAVFALALFLTRTSVGEEFVAATGAYTPVNLDLLVLVASFLVAATVRHAVTPRSMLRHRWQLTVLRWELRVRVSLFPIVLLNAPTLVNRARVDDRIWRHVFALFVSRIRFAVVDLSDYAVGSELDWELRQLKAGGVPTLFICREAERARAEEELGRLGWGDSPWLVGYDPRNPKYEKLIFHLATFSKFLRSRRNRIPPPWG